MCGIAGVIGPGHREAIVPVTRALAHRGPDDEHFFHDESISLGQRRLSIIDIKGGRQPIANETGAIQLVCNGEIYNSPELRAELAARGHRFRTATDVEVVLHLYEEEGAACVRRLRGMFALGLWDRPARRLVLARDHLGQKPLFFAQAGERFVFASEVKGVLASGLVGREIDLDGLWHYVSLRYLPDHYTLFRGVRKLPAATVAVFEDGRLAEEKYWRLSFREKLPHDEAAIADGLDALLRETVKLHLLSDVPVGTFLSGGIDSSTVTAMMAGIAGAPFPTFSIGVKEEGFNELPWARLVAERYHLPARERIVEADMIHLIPAMVAAMDEPADPFGAGVYLVSQLASEEVKVVLSGDGGDENFAGYDRFAGQRLAEIYSVLPAWFRREVMGRAIRLVPESFGYKSLAQKLAWMNDMSFYGRGERYARSMSFLRFTEEGKERLFTPAARAQLTDRDSVAKILAWFDAEAADDLVDRMLHTDLMTRMPDHLLAITDRMSMAHGLEVRPPLMDYRLVEYAASIPADLKLRGRRLKYILKKVAAHYLPPELIERKKQGFGFPIARWMRTELAGTLRNLFERSRFVELGFFEHGALRALLDEHLSGRVDHNFRLWILLNLEVWHRLCIEGQSPEQLRAFMDGLGAPAAASGRA
ncbi:MAG TPA: asparagine synthase (glutamine-hydrolyzing) [Candidatus Methanoperedens sp.]|nr:asparagine synthase (glutamine-hydrolyzing) [Candidatus Methanoperedens sp.]